MKTNEIKNMKFEIDNLKKHHDSLMKRHEQAVNFTGKFLSKCSELKIKAVCVGVRHSIVPSSMTYPFGADGSVFAEGNDENGRVLAWQICEDMGIAGGCGNPGQHQADIENILEGAYLYKKGKWQKVDEVGTL